VARVHQQRDWRRRGVRAPPGRRQRPLEGVDRGGKRAALEPHGRELLFTRGDSLYSIALPPSPGADFHSGPPHALIEARYQLSTTSTFYDIAPDGNRFVFVRTQVGQSSEQVNLVLHWFDQLRVARR